MKHPNFLKHHRALKLSILSKTLLGGLFYSSSCYALQTYPLIDHEKTTISVSQKEYTRMAVLGDRIQQIFGAEGAFDVQMDEEGGQIFLMLRKGGRVPHESEGFSLTLITEEGLTQDLKLIPQEIESQSILFKPSRASLEKEPPLNITSDSHQEPPPS